MSYVVRTMTGLGIALVDNYIAGKIMREVKGHWKQKEYLDGTKEMAYILDTDTTYGNSEMRIALMKGYYLVKGRD